ncbi:MAG: hypothetical protein GX748_01920 [Lentisphaerae bacterium]|nr:hypothetical protein [Lentisphaerota bacterium]
MPFLSGLPPRQHVSGIEIGPDAVFQLSGTMGVATRSYFPQSVACVRLSDEALTRRDFLVARNDPADRTLLRYRFHGVSGAVAGAAGTPRWFRNEANPLPAYDAYAAANYSTAEFSGDTMRPYLAEASAKLRNATSLSSATNGIAACFRLRAGCVPELLHRSFTVETFFKAENVAMNVLPLFGQGAGAGLDTGWCAFLNQGRLAVRHYLQGVGSQQAAMTTGGLSGFFDEFRFSRGVLAPETFLRPCDLPGTVVTVSGSAAAEDGNDEDHAAEICGIAPTALAPFAT